jgi:hypothetical protein
MVVIKVLAISLTVRVAAVQAALLYSRDIMRV